MTSTDPGARTTTRLLAGVGLGAFLVACAVVLAPVVGGDGERAATPAAADTTTAAPEASAPRVRIVGVRLAAAGTYDPEGDRAENDAEAPLAVDGDPRTAWSTESYQSFFKQGVGLVLDAGAVRRLQRLDLVTGTPGVSAAVQVGKTPEGPFRPIARARTLAQTTRIPLGGARGRYVLVWITAIPDGGDAEIAEARLRARS